MLHLNMRCPQQEIYSKYLSHVDCLEVGVPVEGRDGHMYRHYLLQTAPDGKGKAFASLGQFLKHGGWVS